jgi:hypothetical protein
MIQRSSPRWVISRFVPLVHASTSVVKRKLDGGTIATAQATVRGELSEDRSRNS